MWLSTSPELVCLESYHARPALTGENILASSLCNAIEFLLLPSYLICAHDVLGWDGMRAPCSVLAGCGLVVFVEEALAVGL